MKNFLSLGSACLLAVAILIAGCQSPEQPVVVDEFDEDEETVVETGEEAAVETAVATVVAVNVDEASCTLEVEEADGTTATYDATQDVCADQELAGQTVTLTFDYVETAAVEGEEPTTQRVVVSAEPIE